MEASGRAFPGVMAIAVLLFFSGGPYPRAADCNRNGVDDAEDIASGTSRDCNRNAVPDECDVRGKIDFVEGPSTELDFRIQPAHFKAADLDGDEAADLVLARLPTTGDSVSSLRLLRGDGKGAFSEARVDLPDRPLGLAVGDFNGDSRTDVAVAAKGVLWILANRGGGTLGDPLSYSSPFATAYAGMLAAHMNGDEHLDLVSLAPVPGAGESLLNLMLNGGKGDFDFQSGLSTLAMSSNTQTFSRTISAADFNHDEAVDIVSATSPLTISWNGGGILSSMKNVGGDYAGVAASDMNADGLPDLVAATSGYNESALTVLLNFGDGSFPFSARSTLSGSLVSFETFDADGDRHPDAIAALVVATLGQGTIQALQNQGNGALRQAQEITAGGGLTHTLAADFDADGKMDVAAIEVGASSSRIVVLWNRSTAPASRDGNRNGIPDECGDRNFHRGDPNDDGDLNLSDALFILRYLFTSGDETRCKESSDANDDGDVNIADPIFILQYLFLGALGGNRFPPPGPPGDPCGPDPAGSPAFLGCDAYTHCP